MHCYDILYPYFGLFYRRAQHNQRSPTLLLLALVRLNLLQEVVRNPLLYSVMLRLLQKTPTIANCDWRDLTEIGKHRLMLLSVRAKLDSKRLTHCHHINVKIMRTLWKLQWYVWTLKHIGCPKKRNASLSIQIAYDWIAFSISNLQEMNFSLLYTYK